MDIKKPQLEELVQTAESLKTDTNRQELHQKGKYIFPLFIRTFVMFSSEDISSVASFSKAAKISIMLSCQTLSDLLLFRCRRRLLH